ncbi:MAG: holo-ACP synthase [Gemmatimonadaceae bacterium]
MIIGVGIDLVEVERVQRMLDAHGSRLLNRVFTDGEREYSMGMARPALHLAVRLAAKEAAFKALSGTEGARGIGWGEIEVTRDALGRPSVTFHGRAAERAGELRVARCHCSLTHTDSSAAAVVVLEALG